MNTMNNVLFSANKVLDMKTLNKIFNHGDTSIIEPLAQLLLLNKNENVK